jgi:hypothetical protein
MNSQVRDPRTPTVDLVEPPQPFAPLGGRLAPERRHRFGGVHWRYVAGRFLEEEIQRVEQ